MIAKSRGLLLSIGLGLSLLPAVAVAQSASGIAGVVRDASGSVLPGVTVEASSPALIEKVRAATTDGAGQYRIIDLVPGTYVVKFSLTGFSTLSREGIELTTNFTAQVNAEMKVGAFEETLTVTGASPVVDVLNAQTHQQLSRQMLDELPTGRSSWAIGKVLPGISNSGTNPDVGGTAGFQQLTMFVHGSKGDISYQIDGLSIMSPIGNGIAPAYYNSNLFQEATYTTSAISAERPYGGVWVQFTSREGSNRFRGDAAVELAPWQSDNFTPELKAAGLVTTDEILNLWDESFQFGGPIKRDKVWFFYTIRYNGGNFLKGNSFYRDPALCQLDWGTTHIEREHGCQGIDDNTLFSNTARMTYQVTQRNKIGAFYTREHKERGHNGVAAGVSPEATSPMIQRLSYHTAVKWTAPITNRFLWEAGVSQYYLNYTSDYQPVVAPNAIAKQDLVLGTTWDAAPGGFFIRNNYKRYWSATMSYVPGSHAFKAGFQYNHAVSFDFHDVRNGHVVEQFQNGRPSSVRVDNTPVGNRPRHNEWGVFLQDSWTLKRLTINPGVRYDWYHPWIAAQDNAAGRWVPARSFPEIHMRKFTNTSGRLSIIYDLFGDARTAIKGSVNQYVEVLGNGTADRYNPGAETTDTRTWDGTTIGPATVSNFGTVTPIVQGSSLKRRRDIEMSAGVQREVLPRLSTSVMYFRRTFLDIRQTVNTLVSPTLDFTPLDIPDPRGNGQMIAIYNLNRSKLGLTRFVDEASSKNREYWNGIELAATGRIGTGGNVYSGLTIGKASQNLCDVADPNELRFCERSEPWRSQFKLGGSYPLPWNAQVSGTFSSFPGGPLGVSYLVTRTVAPTLVQTRITVPLDNPSDPERYLPRQNQVDLRFTKRINFTQDRRLNVQFDMFNLLNVATVTQAQQNFGPVLYQPRAIIFGRLFQLGAHFYF